MGRSPCCDEVGVMKGPWTTEEDQKLVEYIQKHGHGSWRNLPKCAGLNRCGKSCRLRWTNYLRPDIKRGKFSEEEEMLIIDLHSVLGNKWSAIATRLSGRTDNEIKNYWNTRLKKKLLQMGIDPVTHRRRTDLDLLNDIPALLAAVNFSNLATPWDNQLRMQANAAQLSRFPILQSLPQIMNNTSGPSPTFDPMSLVSSTSRPNYQLNDLIQLSRQLGALMNGSITPAQNSFPSTFAPNDLQGFYEQEMVSQINPLCSIGGDTNQMINSYSLPLNGSSTPSLVSTASPDINATTFGQSKREPINSNDISGVSSTSTADNASEGLQYWDTDPSWKDILDQISRDGGLYGVKESFAHNLLLL